VVSAVEGNRVGRGTEGELLCRCGRSVQSVTGLRWMDRATKLNYRCTTARQNAPHGKPGRGHSVLTCSGASVPYLLRSRYHLLDSLSFLITSVGIWVGRILYWRTIYVMMAAFWRAGRPDVPECWRRVCALLITPGSPFIVAVPLSRLGKMSWLSRTILIKASMSRIRPHRKNQKRLAAVVQKPRP
jgi:hypothetical protein